MTTVSIGDVVGGANFVVVTCRGCGTQTLLTIAGGNLRSCPCKGRQGISTEAFLLERGGVCTSVGVHQVDPNPEDAEPDGDWETA